MLKGTGTCHEERGFQMEEGMFHGVRYCRVMEGMAPLTDPAVAIVSRCMSV